MKERSYGTDGLVKMNRERYMYVFTQLVGKKVIATVREHKRWEGIFHSADGDKDFSIVLKYAKLVGTRGPIHPTLILPNKDFVSIVENSSEDYSDESEVTQICGALRTPDDAGINVATGNLPPTSNNIEARLDSYYNYMMTISPGNSASIPKSSSSVQHVVEGEGSTTTHSPCDHKGAWTSNSAPPLSQIKADTSAAAPPQACEKSDEVTSTTAPDSTEKGSLSLNNSSTQTFSRAHTMNIPCVDPSTHDKGKKANGTGHLPFPKGLPAPSKASSSNSKAGLSSHHVPLRGGEKLRKMRPLAAKAKVSQNVNALNLEVCGTMESKYTASGSARVKMGGLTTTTTTTPPPDSLVPSPSGSARVKMRGLTTTTTTTTPPPDSLVPSPSVSEQGKKPLPPHPEKGEKKKIQNAHQERTEKNGANVNTNVNATEKNTKAISGNTNGTTSAKRQGGKTASLGLDSPLLPGAGAKKGHAKEEAKKSGHAKAEEAKKSGAEWKGQAAEEGNGKKITGAHRSGSGTGAQHTPRTIPFPPPATFPATGGEGEKKKESCPGKPLSELKPFRAQTSFDTMPSPMPSHRSRTAQCFADLALESRINASASTLNALNLEARGSGNLAKAKAAVAPGPAPPSTPLPKPTSMDSISDKEKNNIRGLYNWSAGLSLRSHTHTAPGIERRDQNNMLLHPGDGLSDAPSTRDTPRKDGVISPAGEMAMSNPRNGNAGHLVDTNVDALNSGGNHPLCSGLSSSEGFNEHTARTKSSSAAALKNAGVGAQSVNHTRPWNSSAAAPPTTLYASGPPSNQHQAHHIKKQHQKDTSSTTSPSVSSSTMRNNMGHGMHQAISNRGHMQHMSLRSSPRPSLLYPPVKEFEHFDRVLECNGTLAYDSILIWFEAMNLTKMQDEVAELYPAWEANSMFYRHCFGEPMDPLPACVMEKKVEVAKRWAANDAGGGGHLHGVDVAKEKLSAQEQIDIQLRETRETALTVTQLTLPLVKNRSNGGSNSNSTGCSSSSRGGVDAAAPSAHSSRGGGGGRRNQLERGNTGSSSLVGVTKSPVSPLPPHNNNNAQGKRHAAPPGANNNNTTALSSGTHNYYAGVGGAPYQRSSTHSNAGSGSNNRHGGHNKHHNNNRGDNRRQHNNQGDNYHQNHHNNNNNNNNNNNHRSQQQGQGGSYHHNNPSMEHMSGGLNHAGSHNGPFPINRENSNFTINRENSNARLAINRENSRSTFDRSSTGALAAQHAGAGGGGGDHGDHAAGGARMNNSNSSNNNGNHAQVMNSPHMGALNLSGNIQHNGNNGGGAPHGQHQQNNQFMTSKSNNSNGGKNQGMMYGHHHAPHHSSHGYHDSSMGPMPTYPQSSHGGNNQHQHRYNNHHHHQQQQQHGGMHQQQPSLMMSNHQHGGMHQQQKSFPSSSQSGGGIAHPQQQQQQQLGPFPHQQHQGNVTGTGMQMIDPSMHPQMFQHHHQHLGHHHLGPYQPTGDPSNNPVPQAQGMSSQAGSSFPMGMNMNMNGGVVAPLPQGVVPQQLATNNGNPQSNQQSGGAMYPQASPPLQAVQFPQSMAAPQQQGFVATNGNGSQQQQQQQQSSGSTQGNMRSQNGNGNGNNGNGNQSSLPHRHQLQPGIYHSLNASNIIAASSGSGGFGERTGAALMLPTTKK